MQSDNNPFQCATSVHCSPLFLRGQQQAHHFMHHKDIELRCREIPFERYYSQHHKEGLHFLSVHSSHFLRLKSIYFILKSILKKWWSFLLKKWANVICSDTTVKKEHGTSAHEGLARSTDRCMGMSRPFSLAFSNSHPGKIVPYIHGSIFFPSDIWTQPT